MFNNSGTESEIERFNLFVARDDGSCLGKYAANGFLSPTLRLLFGNTRGNIENLHARRMDNAGSPRNEQTFLLFLSPNRSLVSIKQPLGVKIYTESFSMENFVTQIELKADGKFSPYVKALAECFKLAKSSHRAVVCVWVSKPVRTSFFY